MTISQCFFPHKVVWNHFALHDSNVFTNVFWMFANFLVKSQCKLVKHHFHEFFKRFDLRYFSREIAMQISQTAFSRVFFSVLIFAIFLVKWQCKTVNLRIFTDFLKSKIKPLSVGPLWRSKVRELASARAYSSPTFLKGQFSNELAPLGQP